MDTVKTVIHVPIAPPTGVETLLMPREVADILRIKLGTVRSKLWRGEIPGAVKVGHGQWRVKASVLKRSIEDQKQALVVSIGHPDGGAQEQLV